MDYNEFDDYGTGYEEQMEAAADAAADTATALLMEEGYRSCAEKTCWIGDQHDNDCLPF